MLNPPKTTFPTQRCVEQQAALKALIIDHVFHDRHKIETVAPSAPNDWLFDFRTLLMNGRAANLISDCFYDSFHDRYPFQLCALEIAGVPLVTSLMTKFFYRGHEDMNAFFIRKSRKKDDLMRMIEGTITDERRIILVDDIMNSGNSFWRQIEVLEALGYTVDTVWSILRYRDQSYYERFHKRDITVESLFTLDDFTELSEIAGNLKPPQDTPIPMPFSQTWHWQSEQPSYQYVVQKSQPAMDDTRLYMGSDKQQFWAINQKDGSVAWRYTVGASAEHKAIFSNPLLYKHLVVFGAYDGTIYALHKDTGAVVWTHSAADWVGSSPVLAPELGLIFIGLEFGLIFKRGGIVALDARTGNVRWRDYSHPAFTHSTPYYIKKHKQVVIGSNDGRVRLYDAKSGELIWDFPTLGGRTYRQDSGSGFSTGDIKESFAYDAKRDLIIFGSIDGSLYIINRKDQQLVHQYTCEFGIYSTPLIYKNRIYFTSVDKHLRCIDLDSFALVFERNVDNTRIFSSPTVINGRLYIGTNAGRLHELDPETGHLLGYFQALERITNTVLYNRKTDRYFLPTFANEILCLKRSAD